MFSRGSNPSIDRPILRKSEAYAAQQVEDFRADWVDPSDHAKGILCRELLYRAPLEFFPEPVAMCALLPCLEPSGTRLKSPATSRVVRAIRSGLIVRARMWAKASTISA